MKSQRRRGRFRLVALVGVVVVIAVVWWLRGAVALAPAPSIELHTDRPAIGNATKVAATFREPERGLGAIKLELIQGDKSVVLGQQSFARASTFALRRGTIQTDSTLEAVVGRGKPEWLREGEAVLRASADRLGGTFRSALPTVVEQKVTVRLRPPQLSILSSQHYVRQGGSGIVLLRAGDSASRSGVRVADREFVSFPRLGGVAGERFALFGVPWNVSDPAQLKVFAEDDAGNRVELSFVTIFKPYPPKHDTIQITDSFLESAVPAISSASPGFDASGTLLDQYLRINGAMRKEDLAKIATLAGNSEPRLLWSGPFLQMANSQRRAGYAEQRSYEYNGKSIDRQTHLGLDLASTANAPVPAPNAGKVVLAEFFGIYGNAVIIDHGFGLFSLSGHLSSIAVKAGDIVTKGQTVGKTGATGLAGGDHLHLEMFVAGTSVDPVEWLDAHWIDDNVLLRLGAAAR